MPRNCHSLGWLLALLLAAGGGGCGSGRNKPVKVEGIVILDGNPLPGATVTFVPAEESRRPASGLTDADGAFELTTFNSGDGALPGEYKITVNKMVDEPLPEDTQEKGLAGKKTYYAAAKSPKGKKSIAARAASSPVSAVYRDLNRTPLRQVVPAEGRVQIKLSSTPQ